LLDLAVCLIISPTVLSAQNLDFSENRVLLLYSYHSTFPTSSQVLDGIRSVFVQKAPVIEVEYMDSKRLFDATSQALFLANLTYKLKHRDRYDVIITADDNALNFALTHQDNLFVDTPIVFLGVNDRENALLQDQNSAVTGVVEATSIGDTVRIAQAIRPKMFELHIIVDDTPSGQADLVSVLQLRTEFPELHFNVISLAELSWGGFEEHIINLPGQGATLLLSAYVDKNGVRLSFDESLALINANIATPVLHLWEHGLGGGITGGMVISHFEQGRTAAQIAKDILLGASVSDISVIQQSPNRPVFDVRQLDRFGINKKKLPDHSELLYADQIFFQRYLPESLVIVTILLFMMTAIIYLARQNRIRLRLSKSLQEREALLRTIINEIPDHFSTRDNQGRYLLVNKEHAQFYNADVGFFKGKKESELFFQPSQMRARNRKLSLAIVLNTSQVLFENITHPVTGKVHHFRTYFEPLQDLSGDARVIHISQDITEIITAQEKLKKNEHTLRTILDNVDAYIYMKDLDGNYIFANQKVRELFNASLEQIIGKGDADYFNSETAKKIRAVDSMVISSGHAHKVEENIHPAASMNSFVHQSTKLPLHNEAGHIYALCGISVDVTERKKHEIQLERMAHYDSLTGLPNRLLFSDRLKQAMTSAKRNQMQITVMYLDLDGFKEINDTYGHQSGDQMLKVIGERIRSEVRASDTFARYGGDEFVAMLINKSNSDLDIELITRLLTIVAKPVQIADVQLSVSASIGITRYPQSEPMDADQLVRQADQAMYLAKTKGRNRFHFFDAEVEKTAIAHEKFINEIQQALNQHQFELYYQPKVNLQTGIVTGLEALVRWRNPIHGLVLPGEFLPEIENHPIIIKLDECVIKEALHQLSKWQAAGLDLPVSVNVSNLLLGQKDFTSKLANALNIHPHLAPQLLELEILETRAIENLTHASIVMNECQKLGVKFSLDDFGTGYSSLTYLKKLPVSSLKIDRSFVRDMLVDKDDLSILEGILGLSQAFNLDIIVEGTETQEHCQRLKKMGFSLVQGFAIAKPMPASEVMDWVEQWQPEPAWFGT